MPELSRVTSETSTERYDSIKMTQGIVSRSATADFRSKNAACRMCIKFYAVDCRIRFHVGKVVDPKHNFWRFHERKLTPKPRVFLKACAKCQVFSHKFGQIFVIHESGILARKISEVEIPEKCSVIPVYAKEVVHLGALVDVFPFVGR